MGPLAAPRAGEGLDVGAECVVDVAAACRFRHAPGFRDAGWQVVTSRCWESGPDHIVHGEGRAVVLGMKHKMRAARYFSKVHVLVSDSITNVFALNTGRSSKRSLLGVTRSAAALQLASRCRFVVCWEL